MPINKGRIKPIVEGNNSTSLLYLNNGTCGIKWSKVNDTTNGQEYKANQIGLMIDVGMELLNNAMYYAKTERGCAGLASIQIGHDYTNQFVAKVHGKWEVFTEPQLGISSTSYVTREGCLSLPKKKHSRVKVVRFECDHIQYLDWEKLQQGIMEFKILKAFNGDFTEFEGQVFQHEKDHLEGILITKHKEIYNV